MFKIPKVLVIVFVLFNSLLSAKNPVIKCFYQVDQFVIDGNSDDWGDMAFYDDKTAVVSNLSNDDQYLYVKIRIGSGGAIQRIFMGGMRLWFDPKGKKKCVKGLVFPSKHDFEAFVEAQKQLKESKADKDRIKRMFKQKLELFNQKYKTGLASISMIDQKEEVYHFEPTNLNEEGLSAILYLKSNDLLYYEARIPLDLIFEDKEKYLSGKKTFSYGFEFGGFEVEEMREEARKMQNQMNTTTYGNQNRYDGYQNTQRMQSHMIDSYGIIPPIKVWYKKVYLAQKK